MPLSPLSARRIDPSSPLPLYRQIADELLSAIRGGHYAPGESIPSEPDLAEGFKVGRPTVRQATEFLVRQGLLERRRGSGTYVRQPEPAVDLFTLSGTLAAFHRQGMELATQLLQPPQLIEIPDSVDHPFAGRRVYVLVRLGNLSKVPVLLEQLFFDPDVFPGLDALNVGEQSLSELVARHYQRRPSGGRQVFGVAPAPREFAKALGTAAQPLLVVRRTLDFPGAAGAIFAVMHCRTDRVELVQTLSERGIP